MRLGTCLGCGRPELLVSDYCISCEREYESQYEEVDDVSVRQTD